MLHPLRPRALPGGARGPARYSWHQRRPPPPRAAPQAQPDSNDSPSQDPRTAVFFPAEVYRPVEYVKQLCAEGELPEEVSAAIVRQISRGKGALGARALSCHVANAAGIIAELGQQAAVPIIQR